MKSLAYCMLLGLSFVIENTLWAMEENFFLTHELFVDWGTPEENIGFLRYPQIGVYDHPYRMAVPLLALHSEALLDCMPSAITQHLMTMYGGGIDAYTVLFNRLMSQELNIAFLIMPSLPDKPQTYNVVFHPLVAGWLGKTPMEGFNVPIQAGIFNPLGVQSTSEPIAFNTFGPLAVNLHDIDNYSPNNGRFGIENKREVASFWVAGSLQNHATVAYVLLLNQVGLENDFKAMVSELAFISSVKKQLEHLIQNFERIAKQLDAEGKRADSDTLTSALDCLKSIYAKKFQPTPTSMPAVSVHQQSTQHCPSPQTLNIQHELQLLHDQLYGLAAALK